MLDDIVDRIYEASVIPELWIDVLDRLAAIARCDGGLLIVADRQQSVRAVSSACLSPMLDSFINEGWMRQNIRATRLSSKNYFGFVVDHDLVTEEEATTDPFYVNCLRKYGGGVGTGTVIPAPSGDLIIFNIERSHKKGYVERDVLPVLDALRPHLARSALLSARLGLERARAMTETLNRLDLPGAVLSETGRLMSTNSLLERRQEQFRPAAGGMLTLAHRPANEFFQTAVRGSGTQSSSIAIPATDGCDSCVAHLLPIRRNARDIFSGATHLLVVTPVTNPSALPVHVLHGLFDLTPAEARVAQKIVEGNSIAKIAKENNLSPDTVRNQLKAVFSKTGTSRQAELVGLLAVQQVRADPSH